MAERIDGRQFWGGEGAGEAKYEVSHVVGKGSYGVVWWEHFLSQWHARPCLMLI